MKSNNLTISLPNLGCDKICPYCISNMTPSVTTNIALFQRNLHKVKQFALSCNVNNVLVTSRGEPMLASNWVNEIGYKFNSFALELQTNGKELNRFLYKVKRLYLEGYNVIAVSIDDPKDFFVYHDLWNRIIKQNMIIRVILVLTKKFSTDTLTSLISTCKYYGIRQLTLRNVTVPSKIVSDDKALYTKDWIEKI